MIYAPREIDISKRYLEIIFARIKGTACLLGGWATYYLVNRNFEKNTGRKYVGSRDVDIGFHIDKKWSEEQLRKSAFSSTVNIIQQVGFYPLSFRFAKDFDSETGKELTPQEAARLPLYRIIQLYIDPVVDYIHPGIKNVMGFVPIDEPLLSLVYTSKEYTTKDLSGIEVLLPKPHVLLAMKLNAVPKRDKEHKRIKDIADIYALLWFSDVGITRLKSVLFAIYSRKKAKKTTREFSDEEIAKVSAAIGIDKTQIKRVLTQL